MTNLVDATVLVQILNWTTFRADDPVIRQKLRDASRLHKPIIIVVRRDELDCVSPEARALAADVVEVDFLAYPQESTARFQRALERHHPDLR